ncbi:uncharacterized protein EI90DRAFT_377017 [Cantharellus anzutake]|uniref:uncharacterized protein n=1 Tax=Cantharellus anzutake TaxID=1750568 RepID=UPI0019038E1E|nr:uncharacterized protein EI90DRAFT_377017 [Cantharellus anzutake]KAF8334930.1 hypothetical protein EI90DRAFT_377017 [Cantharellus anzutake]
MLLKTYSTTSSQLFSRDSNELQNEFNSFITRNHVLTFAHLQSHMEETWHGEIFPEQLLRYNNHDSIQLLRDLHQVTWNAEKYPWRFYRSDLPFAPPSVYKQYGHLSGVRVFSIRDKSGDTIPLSKDLCRAREVMHAKLAERVGRWGREVSYEVEFYQPDIRNGVVTCAALSLDGRHVALGFGSGVIEVVDIDHQRTICQLQHNSANLPDWIEFVHGSHRVATEDIDGNVAILGHGMAPVKLGNLPSGLYPAGTAISDNGLFIIRAPRNFNNPWCDNMTLISVSEHPFIQALTSPSDLSVPFPSSPSRPPSPSTPYRSETTLSRPHRRTLGFSPGTRYVGAFDGFSAFTWSTQSYELIACYRVTDSFFWIISPNVPPTHLHLVPDPIFTRAIPLAEDNTAYAHPSEDAARDSEDESWIKCPFYDLSPSSPQRWYSEFTSSATGRNPLIRSWSVMLGGREMLSLPGGYNPVTSLLAWYGHRVPGCRQELYCPQSSRDGTRFLVQGKSKAPMVIDISQIV